MSSNFIYLYFVFAYYIGFAPYRFKKLGNGLSIPRSYWPQKLVCGVFHFLSLYIYVSSLRCTIEWLKIRNPVTYFRLFENVSSVFYKVLVVKCLWGNQALFLKLVNFPQSGGFQFENGRGIYRKMIESPSLILTFHLTHAVLAALRMLTPNAYPLTLSYQSSVGFPNQTVSNWYETVVSMSRDIYFQSDIVPSPGSPVVTHQIAYSFKEMTVVGITATSLFMKFIMGSFSDVLLLMMTLSLWFSVKDFEMLLECNVADTNEDEEKPNDIIQTHPKEKQTAKCGCVEKWNKCSKLKLGKVESNVVIVYYESLQRLSKLINQCIGDLLIPFIMEGIFTYAINFNDILFLGTITQGMVVFSFYSMFALNLSLGSKICQKIRKMKEWLYQHELTLSSRQLILLLDSIDKDVVAIALPGIMTINFSLVGQLVSALLTYFIIRLQYKDDS